MVAIGPGKGAAESKEDHSCIFDKLRSDLDNINNKDDGSPIPLSFISRAHYGSLCTFYLSKEIYFSEANTTENSNVYIMDNPERRSNFGLLGGNSLNHAYFGLSCNFGQLQVPFQACKKCCKDIMKYCLHEGWMDQESPLPKCKVCHGFSIEHLLQKGRYSSPVYIHSNNLDISELPGHHLFNKPGKLTNDILIDAYISARDLFLSGKMSEKSMKGYLGTLCFNSKTITDLIVKCRLYQLSQDIINGCNEITADDRLEVSIAEEESESSKVEKPTPPAMLYICNLDCSIETIMHLGMNTSKHCEQASFNWAKDIPGFSCAEMIAGAQQYIKSIDSLKLADFPVMQFKTDSMGGYVVENHRAYIQIAPWCFRWINEYKDKRNSNWIDDLDIKHLEDWTQKGMFSFLSVRGVTVSRKFKHELTRRVKECKNLPVLQKFETFQEKI